MFVCVGGVLDGCFTKQQEPVRNISTDVILVKCEWSLVFCRFWYELTPWDRAVLCFTCVGGHTHASLNHPVALILWCTIVSQYAMLLKIIVFIPYTFVYCRQKMQPNKVSKLCMLVRLYTGGHMKGKRSKYIKHLCQNICQKSVPFITLINNE